MFCETKHTLQLSLFVTYYKIAQCRCFSRNISGYIVFYSVSGSGVTNIPEWWNRMCREMFCIPRKLSHNKIVGNSKVFNIFEVFIPQKEIFLCRRMFPGVIIAESRAILTTHRIARRTHAPGNTVVPDDRTLCYTKLRMKRMTRRISESYFFIWVCRKFSISSALILQLYGCSR